LSPRNDDERLLTEGEGAGEKGLRAGARFFSEHESAIADYAGQAGLTFEMGDAWTFDMQKRRGTFDPVFFLNRNFTEAEIMWAACHEIEHFLDWLRDPEGYAALLGRTEKERRLDLLYHYINDIMVNREEDRRFPAHWETKEQLYSGKFFPRVDYSSTPKHLQFITAMVRERMLPGEPIFISPDVRAALMALSNIDGEGTDLVDLVTDPTARPRDRFGLILDYIEPVYERFFQEDVSARKKEQKEGGERKAETIKRMSLEGGSRKTDKGRRKELEADEALFAFEYHESMEKLAQVFSPTEAREEIEKEIMRQREEDKSAEQIAKEQFRSQYGVSAEEVEDYAEEYKKIEGHVDPLRSVFERIISTRKETRRRLKERTDEGVILDPSMMAQAYIDAESGILNSRTQLKIMKEEFDENKPKDFEFTLICDLSGSMNENRPGGKSFEQKSSAILITEALDEFEKRLKAERLERAVDLHVRTEVRGFHSGDEELKPLSDSIDFETRVKISRRLDSCTGARTADYKSLARVVAAIDKDARKRLEDRELKKVLILISDGGSDDPALALEAKRRLVDLGVIAKAIQIGKPSNQEIRKFRHVWQKDGSPCRDVSQLVRAIERLLEDFLKDL
jgi:hypothetical protein